MFGTTFTIPGTERVQKATMVNRAESIDGSDISDILPPAEQIHVHSAKGRINDMDNETEEEFKERLTYWIEQMMFVSGETAEPSAETTGMIEELVKQQVIEMVSYLH